MPLFLCCLVGLWNWADKRRPAVDRNKEKKDKEKNRNRKKKREETRNQQEEEREEKKVLLNLQ